MQQVIIRRPRMIVALQEDEILSMLKQRPDIWAVALKRGKSILRCETSMNRKGKN